MHVKTVLYVTTGLTVLGISLVYGSAGRWIGVLAAVIVGFFFVQAQRLGLAWLSTAGLFGFVGLAMFGAWSGFPAIWLLVSVSLALVSWNLAFFSEQTWLLTKEQVAQGLITYYLARLAIVTGAGFLAGLAALFVETQINFVGAMFIAATMIGGLALVVRYLVRQNERRGG